MNPKLLSLLVPWLICAGGVLSLGDIAVAQTPIQYEDQKLLVSDAPPNGWFGMSAAVHGGTAVVCSFDNFSRRENAAAYVFRRDSFGQWIEEAKLVPSDADDAYHAFGYSVGFDGETIVVGAPQESGAAYVFVRDNSGGWREQAKLQPSDPHIFGRFGRSVDVDGDTLLVGAPGAQVVVGSAYVFKRNESGVWTEQKKLLPSVPISRDILFGGSVAVSDTWVVVGARNPYLTENLGDAYVYMEDGTGNWTEQAKLGSVMLPDERQRDFGSSVDLDGNTAVVSQPERGGSVFVFVRDGSGLWHQEAKLSNYSGAPQTYEVAHVSIDSNMVVISGSGRIPGGSYELAYIFTRDLSGNWHEKVRLLNSDSADDDGFGGPYSPSLGVVLPVGVALHDGTVLIGAPGHDDNGPDAGAAYVFDVSSYLEPKQIFLDVKPDDPNNVINPRSRGRFWVAILSEDTFDALRVDPTSVKLGAGGASPDKYRVRDSNHDGVADLLVRFRTPNVGIVCGDTSVELTGQTHDGVEIVAEDDLRTVGCKEPKPKSKGKKK